MDLFFVFLQKLFISFLGFLFNYLPKARLGYFVLTLLQKIENGGIFGRLYEPLRYVIDGIYMALVIIDKQFLLVLNLFN